MARIALAAALAGAVAGCGVARPAGGPALVVAAASDVGAALGEISAAFARTHPADVRLSLGSSGLLAAQIEQGAPFDLFFSADETYVSALARDGFVAPDTIREYAIGRLALWTRSAAVDVSRGLGVLAEPAVRYVAIANPEHAPYGRAALEALTSAGLRDRVRPKFVIGENVSQALQMAQSGNADAALVALSLAVESSGRWWLVPDRLYRPIKQAAGVVTRSAHRDLARAFLEFVLGPEGRAALERRGFALPGAAP